MLNNTHLLVVIIFNEMSLYYKYVHVRNTCHDHTYFLGSHHMEVAGLSLGGVRGIKRFIASLTCS